MEVGWDWAAGDEAWGGFLVGGFLVPDFYYPWTGEVVGPDFEAELCWEVGEEMLEFMFRL